MAEQRWQAATAVTKLSHVTAVAMENDGQDDNPSPVHLEARFANV